MKRTLMYSGIALMLFGIAISVWLTKPLNRKSSGSADPLLVTLGPVKQAPTSNVPFEHYMVTIKNVSDQTVRGYSLGFRCNCRAWDSDGNLYPANLDFTNPDLERQVLAPGESQEFPFSVAGMTAEQSQSKVWVDLVHFQGGGLWGRNQGHKEGYVRE